MSLIKHHGLREYTSEESGNAALGQLGFVYEDNPSSGDTLPQTHTGHFIAIKVVGGDGTASNHALITANAKMGEGLSAAKILVGEMIYGAYDSVTITSASSLDVKVLLYSGK